MIQYLKCLPVYLLLFFFIQNSSISFAQEKKEDKADWIQFHGFVNYEVIYDTRQGQVAREGEVYLYPKAFESDLNGDDINDHGDLHMYSLHTRIRADIKEVEIYKMKASGAIEFDFIGTNDATLNVIRLRHAFIKLSSSRFEILAGQYWHPMYATDCSPEVISWGAAAPLHVLNRSPQLRFTYFPSPKLSLMASLLSQRDFVSSGPNGNSAEYIRNSQIPEMQFQLVYKPSETFVAGFTAGYKKLVPRLVTDSGYICNESLGSYNFNLFGHFKGNKFDLKLQAIYGQNLNSLMLIGGYAVKRTVNTLTESREYTNINTGSLWIEAAYKIKDFKLGIFAGYTKNFGSEDYISQISDVYGLGNNINYLYNISPRIIYAPGKLKLAFELNNSYASFGDYNHYLRIENDKQVVNFRYLFSSSFNF